MRLHTTRRLLFWGRQKDAYTQWLPGEILQVIGTIPEQQSSEVRPRRPPLLLRVGPRGAYAVAENQLLKTPGSADHIAPTALPMLNSASESLK